MQSVQNGSVVIMTYKGVELDNITTSANYSQFINTPTHFVNKISSCIDLMFSSNFFLLQTLLAIVELR